MNKSRFARSLSVAVGLIVLIAGPRMARAQNAAPGAVESSRAPESSAPARGVDSASSDDFAGLDFTPEQKAEIETIHQETESRKYAVARDTKLNEDQKNAMILGYTRMEYGSKFKLLSPEQQKLVRQRIAARRMADQAEHKSQPPRN